MTETSYELVMMRGPSTGAVYALSESSLIVGRDPLSNIVVNDPEVSRQHTLLISSSSGEFRVQDLGSTNGTFIDGKRLGSKPEILRPSNSITMGGAVTFVFRERSNIEQREFGEASDPAQIDRSEASSGVKLESEELSRSAKKVGQSDSPKGTGVREPGIPVEQPVREKVQARPSYQQQQPVILQTAVDIQEPGKVGTDEPRETLPNLVLGMAMLILCSCVTVSIFLAYLGGDWLLRQIGLVP